MSSETTIAVADNKITFHGRCANCDYDLFGQRRDGVCPECGDAVRLKTAHFPSRVSLRLAQMGMGVIAFRGLYWIIAEYWESILFTGIDWPMLLIRIAAATSCCASAALSLRSRRYVVFWWASAAFAAVTAISMGILLAFPSMAYQSTVGGPWSIIGYVPFWSLACFVMPSALMASATIVYQCGGRVVPYVLCGLGFIDSAGSVLTFASLRWTPVQNSVFGVLEYLLTYGEPTAIIVGMVSIWRKTTLHRRNASDAGVAAEPSPPSRSP